MSQGKGDTTRPSSVSTKEYDRRWWRTFGDLVTPVLKHQDPISSPTGSNASSDEPSGEPELR